jgi:hypothetical protein
MTFATFLIMHISILEHNPQADFNSPTPSLLREAQQDERRPEQYF